MIFTALSPTALQFVSFNIVIKGHDPTRTLRHEKPIEVFEKFAFIKFGSWSIMLGLNTKHCEAVTGPDSSLNLGLLIISICSSELSLKIFKV